MKRDRPLPPHPELIRRPPRGFGWLDARLLHEEWLGLLGPERIAALTLLELAADHTGSSFYRRETMALALSMQRRVAARGIRATRSSAKRSHPLLRFPAVDLDEALERLLELELVAHRPWEKGGIDGVWQILPVPVRRS